MVVLLAKGNHSLSIFMSFYVINDSNMFYKIVAIISFI